jgi:nuclear pore complex protein Nup160
VLSPLANDKEQPLWIESHNKSSRIRFFSRAADELVTAIAEFNYEDQFPVLYTFSRDLKLRTWSSMTGTCLKTTDVAPLLDTAAQQQQQRSGAEQAPAVVRVVPHPNPSARCSHVVVVFVPTPYSEVPGTFLFFRASSTSSGANDLEFAGARAGATHSAGSQLRGFEVVPPNRTDAADGWRMWATWDSKGLLAADSVMVSDILQFTTYIQPQVRPAMVFDWQAAKTDSTIEALDNSYFDNLIDLEAGDPTNPYQNDDITYEFTSRLFCPGRFSVLTLTTSLEDYIDQLPVAVQDRLHTSVYASLSKRFEAAVGASLKMDISPQTGAPEVVKYRKDFKQQWQGVWARVRELDKQARWPVATAALNGQLLVLDREGAAVPVQRDTAGVLVQLGCSSDAVTSEFQRLHDGVLVKTYPALAGPKARSRLTHLALTGETITSVLNAKEAESGSVFDALVEGLDGEFANGLQEPVEVVARRLWDESVDTIVTEDERQRILAHPPASRGTIIEALDILAEAPATGDKVLDSVVFSGIGNALLTSTVSAIVTARYTLSIQILLCALYRLAATDHEGDDADELIEPLTRAFVTYHRYRVLQLVCEETGEAAAERMRARRLAKRLRGKEDVLADFETLKMREGDDEPEDADGYQTAYSLLHSVLARILPQPVPEHTLAGLFDAAVNFVAELDLLEPEQIDLEPRDADVRLTYALLADGHATAARRITELYPLSSGLAFVRARALLEAGEVDEGVRYLELASAGVQGEFIVFCDCANSIDGSLACIMPACTGHRGLGEYYRRVMSVVDELGLEAPVARFGNLAIQAMDAEDAAARDIWTRVFLAYLTLGQYEDGYSSLTSTPFHDIKRDLLGQLISAMCEANEVGRLVSLGFIGFQRDVEERLNFKARNSDPLRTPNYYKVLYSWHISRGDYRSAGEIMYAQGQRFAEASSAKFGHYELAAMRAQSYLAAINALSLVDKRNAWISVQVGVEAGSKRRKVSSYIPQDEFTPNVQAVDIITLADMRAQYTAVLSQLRLSQQVQNLHDHGVTLTPDETVGFFTQRSMFDEALSSAAGMGVDMTDVFVVLATRCVELARTPGIQLDNPAAAFLAASPVTSRLRGPPAAVALRYLQVALERHDGAPTQWRYRAAVADTFLSLNDDMRAGWQPPVWLVSAELARDPESWVARALAHGWVTEAVGWAAEMLRRHPADLAHKPAALDSAYNLVDRVLAAADAAEKDGSAEPETKTAVAALRAELAHRLNVLAR